MNKILTYRLAMYFMQTHEQCKTLLCSAGRPRASVACRQQECEVYGSLLSVAIPVLLPGLDQPAPPGGVHETAL